MATRLTGTVHRFTVQRGYGFLTRDDGVGEVFVHISQLAGDGPRYLTTGERVTFELGEDREGRQTAVHVERVTASIDAVKQPDPGPYAADAPPPQMYEACE